jgi:hypothetical protein
MCINIVKLLRARIRRLEYENCELRRLYAEAVAKIKLIEKTDKYSNYDIPDFMKDIFKL